MKNKLLLIIVLLITGTVVSFAQPLQANAGTDQSICAGATATLNGSGLYGSGAGTYTYSWSPSSGLSSTTVSNPNANPSVTTSYVLTVTDTNFATATDTVIITVNAAPIVSASNSGPYCAGDTIHLTGSAVGAVAYSWSGPAAFGSSVQNPIISNATIPASGNYTLVATSSMGCTGSGVTSVVVNGIPSVTANSQTICLGANATLTASGATTYLWSPGGLNTSSIMVSPSSTTVYTVTGTSAGCSSSASATVTVNPLPTVTATSATICTGNNATLFASGASTYMWSPGGQNTSSISVSPGATTNYTVTGTNVMGCTNTATTTVTVMPNPVLSVNNPTICSGGTATLTATGATSYIWSTSDSTSTINVSPGVTTSYSVTGTTNGCSTTDTVFVTVTPGLSISITPTNVLCFGGMDGAATANVTGGTMPYNYNWVPGSGPTATVTNLIAGTYTVNVMDANGCTGSNAVTITEMPPISVNAGTDQNVCAGIVASFNGMATGGAGGFMYNWSNGANTPNTNISLAGSYTLSVIDVNGCTGSDSVILSNIPSTDIMGHVNYSSGNLAGANIFLIKQGATSAAFDTINTTITNGSGDFLFPSANAGSYYVRAEGDTSMHMLVNTYFSNAYLWDSAKVVIHGCTVADTVNILMIELPVLSGPGTISGTVVQGLGFGQKITPGSPTPYANVIPGVPVKVGKNPSGTIVASGSTDANGVYTFTNLPIDDYTIYVDIPGYPMDSSYVVSITSSNPTATNLDYVVDSNSVYVDLTLATHSIQSSNTVSYLSTFPNPAQDNATVAFNVTENSNVNFELYNLQGEKVATLLNHNFEKGKYTHTINFDQYGITNGTYIIKATVNNTQHIVRLVVMK